MSFLGKAKTIIGDFIYTNLSKDLGTMLIVTGCVGWVLSSIAQIASIAMNDKIPSSQKKFLIPQEASDAAFNILGFLAITTSLKYVAGKLVSTGKVLPKKVVKFLEQNGFKDKIGSLDFNIPRDVPNFENVKDIYNKCSNFMTSSAAVVGSVVSTNLVTPIFRNNYAAKMQHHYKDKDMKLISPKGISMDQFRAIARGNLRI